MDNENYVLAQVDIDMDKAVASIQELKKQIAERDKTDSERDVAPLTQAVDAVLIDTTGLTIEQAVSKILDLVRRESTLV